MSFASRPLAALVIAACTALSACTSDNDPIRPSLSTPSSLTRTDLALDLIADQYIVTFHDDVGDPAALASTLVAASGGSLLHVYTHTIKGFAARIPASGVAAVAAHASVAQVEQDQLD